MHGPEPYARALADLDALLARHDRQAEHEALEHARRLDEARAITRSLVNAARIALATELEQPARRALHNAVAQYELAQ